MTKRTPKLFTYTSFLPSVLQDEADALKEGYSRQVQAHCATVLPTKKAFMEYSGYSAYEMNGWVDVQDIDGQYNLGHLLAIQNPGLFFYQDIWHYGLASKHYVSVPAEQVKAFREDKDPSTIRRWSEENLLHTCPYAEEINGD